MFDHLPSPNNDAAPLLLTDEQAMLVVDWYALDDAGGFPLRRGIIEMAKGWGKGPLAAALAGAELAGPVVFDGWDADGEPVGRPWGIGDSPPPLIQIAAVSEEQTDNTYGALLHMLHARGGRVADDIGVDAGRSRLFLVGRPGELHPVTSSAGSREGQRVTFAVLDETHLWTRTNGGIRLADTLRRNAAKMGGRTLETTNAPRLGERSVAERSGLDVERGFAGIMHVARSAKPEPQPDWTDEELVAALDYTYGDATWIDRRRLLREIRDPSTEWDDALRFYFNIRKAGFGTAVDPRRWDALAAPGELPPANTPIGLGFDGSISQDETWLVGCDRAGRSFVLGRWHRPAELEGWTVPRAEVMARVEWAMGEYRVGRFYFDPPKWWTEGELWQERYGDTVLALDTNQPTKFAPAVDRWLVGIREGSHTHDGDPALAEHVRAAHLRKVRLAAAEDDGRTRFVIVKGEDRRRIDGAVADILAYEAAMTMPAAAEEPTFAWA